MSGPEKRALIVGWIRAFVALVVILAALSGSGCSSATVQLHPQVVGPAQGASAAIRAAERLILNDPACNAAFEELVSTNPLYLTVGELLRAPVYPLWDVQLVKENLLARTVIDAEGGPAIHLRVGLMSAPNRMFLGQLLTHELAHLAGAEDARPIEALCWGEPSVSESP